VAEPNLTHAQFVAKLVTEGCLRIAQGKLPEKMPVEAVILTPEQKQKAGAHPQALAVFYPLGETGVFMQMRGSQARVWYNGENCDDAVATLEQAIQRAFPAATFVDQQTHPDGAHINVRLYRVPITEGRFIDVETTYPIERGPRQQFVVRLHAKERT
jgi:hypothetical protein